ncbi:MAG TPA: hypothetical protein VMF91_23500 [Bryobacteraceae bacterium]|nr:hypothetical protein [Bryobacteraceae bacterium]
MHDRVNFCTICGTAAPAPAASSPHPASIQALQIEAPLWLFCVIGGLIGAMAGYLTRPSGMLVGQLPFLTVITGGAMLQGFDQMFVPLARQSFDQMLAGAVICAVLGGVAGAMLRRIKSSTPGGNV